MINPSNTRPVIHGVLTLNKTKDATSMDMVRMVKRLTKVKRVGHAGTLDPIATGLLPICFGQATRLMEFIVDSTKLYRAEFTLGVATDTYDAYGTPARQGDWSRVNRSHVEAALLQFMGTTLQQPPMYSALKREGKRLYELARAGVEVERPAREVVVTKLSLLEWAPPRLTVEVECGRGFYMRALAHDLGSALGCGAHLSALVRLRTGMLNIEESVTPEQFEAAVNDGAWEQLVSPPDFVLRDMQTVVVAPAAVRHLINGQAVALRSADVYAQHLEARRAYATDGRFLGVVRFNRAQDQWQPEKLFSLPLPSPYAP